MASYNKGSSVNIFDMEEEDYDTVLAKDIEFEGNVELKKASYD